MNVVASADLPAAVVRMVASADVRWLLLLAVLSARVLSDRSCACIGGTGYGSSCAHWDADDEEPWCRVRGAQACGADDTFESLGHAWSRKPCAGLQVPPLVPRSVDCAAVGFRKGKWRLKSDAARMSERQLCGKYEWAPTRGDGTLCPSYAPFAAKTFCKDALQCRNLGESAFSPTPVIIPVLTRAPRLPALRCQWSSATASRCRCLLRWRKAPWQ